MKLAEIINECEWIRDRKSKGGMMYNVMVSVRSKLSRRNEVQRLGEFEIKGVKEKYTTSW